MNRAVAITLLSVAGVIVVAVLGVAVVGLVLGAKATDEKADETTVTRQAQETSDDLAQLGRQIDDLEAAVEDLSGGQATLEERIGQLEGQVGELQQTQQGIQAQLSDLTE